MFVRCSYRRLNSHSSANSFSENNGRGDGKEKVLKITTLRAERSWKGSWLDPGGTVLKNPPASAGDTRDVGSIPRSGRSPGTGNGNPLQSSCLENLTGRGALWATWGCKELEAAEWLSTHTQEMKTVEKEVDRIHVWSSCISPESVSSS